MVDVSKAAAGKSIINADGEVILSSGELNVNFHIGGFDKADKDPARLANEKKLTDLFQKFQSELDNENPVAKQLLKDISDTNMPSHINLNNKDINKTDMRNGVNFDFDYPRQYYTKDGTATFTPARIFSHEFAHLGGEKTTEDRTRDISVDERSRLFNENLSTKDDRLHKLEDPAVRAENYICEKIFGSAACGPDRTKYTTLKEEEQHSANPFTNSEKLAAVAQELSKLPETQRVLAYEQLAKTANEKGLQIEEPKETRAMEAQV